MILFAYYKYIVYKDLIISTIVDKWKFGNLGFMVYKDLIISTIVDRMGD